LPNGVRGGSGTVPNGGGCRTTSQPPLHPSLSSFRCLPPPEPSRPSSLAALSRHPQPSSLAAFPKPCRLASLTPLPRPSRPSSPSAREPWRESISTQALRREDGAPCWRQFRIGSTRTKQPPLWIRSPYLSRSTSLRGPRQTRKTTLLRNKTGRRAVSSDFVRPAGPVGGLLRNKPREAAPFLPVSSGPQGRWPGF